MKQTGRRCFSVVSINDALGILYKYRYELTRQQIKTIAGQMKKGNTVEGIKGLYKILDRKERENSYAATPCGDRSG